MAKDKNTNPGRGKRKATSAETSRSPRQDRKRRGTTKSGEKRSKPTAPGESALIAEGAKETVESEIPGVRSSSYSTEQRESAGLTSGLSDEAGAAGLSAAELAATGAYFGDYDAPPPSDSARAERGVAERKYWEDFGRTAAGKVELEKALDTLKNPPIPAPRTETPEEARVAAATRESRATEARRSVVRQLDVDPATGVPTRVLPPDVPLTKSDVIARQQFFVGGGDRMRIAAPGSTAIPVIDRFGKATTMTIVRPNVVQAASQRASTIGPAERRAKEANRMLERAEAMEKLDEIASGKVVADTSAKPVTTVEVGEGGGMEAVTMQQRGMTRREALKIPTESGGLTPAERRSLTGREIGSVTSPGLTKIVGSSVVSDQFRANVAAAQTQAEEAAKQPVTAENVQIVGGGAAKDFVDPEDLAAYVERANKSKNPQRYESRDPSRRRWKKLGDPRQAPAGMRGPAPVGLTDAEVDKAIEVMSGSNPTERLNSALDALETTRDPRAREDIVGKLKKARVPEGAQEAIRKEELTPETAFGSQVRTSSSPVGPVSPREAKVISEGTTFLKVAKGRRLLSRAAGRDIGSQTADESALVTAGEDWLRRQITSDLMGGKDPTTSSQAAIHIRAADARRTGTALDQTKLNRAGAAEPTDEQIVIGQRAATHKAATEAANTHINKVYSHLYEQRKGASGYARAAFSQIPDIESAASGIASLGGMRSAVSAAASAAAERYRRSAYWERGEGGAGQTTSRINPAQVEATFSRQAGSAAGKEWVTPKSEPSVSPAVLEGQQATQRAATNRAALMATPEGRSLIEATRAEMNAPAETTSAEPERQKISMLSINNPTFTRDDGSRYTRKLGGYAAVAQSGVRKAYSDWGMRNAAEADKQMQAASEAIGRGESARVVRKAPSNPSLGPSMAGPSYETTKSGYENRLQTVGYLFRQSGMANPLQPMSTMAPFSPGQKEIQVGKAKVRAEGREAPRAGGFFQRVASKGQFGNQ